MINVVAAVIMNEQNEVLIAKRSLNKSQGGLWEFPGGKIENGETEKEAIEREIYEELNVKIKAQVVLGSNVFNYPDKDVNLIAIFCQIVGGELVLKEHIDAKWLKREKLRQYEFSPADLFIVDIVEKI